MEHYVTISLETTPKNPIAGGLEDFLSPHHTPALYRGKGKHPRSPSNQLLSDGHFRIPRTSKNLGAWNEAMAPPKPVLKKKPVSRGKQGVGPNQNEGKKKKGPRGIIKTKPPLKYTNLGDWRFAISDGSREQEYDYEFLYKVLPWYTQACEVYAKDQDLHEETLKGLITNSVYTLGKDHDNEKRYALYEKWADTVGWALRTPLPNMVYHAIQIDIPSLDGKYTGYKETE